MPSNKLIINNSSLSSRWKQLYNHPRASHSERAKRTIRKCDICYGSNCARRENAKLTFRAFNSPSSLPMCTKGACYNRLVTLSLLLLYDLTLGFELLQLNFSGTLAGHQAMHCWFQLLLALSAGLQLDSQSLVIILQLTNAALCSTTETRYGMSQCNRGVWFNTVPLLPSHASTS